MLYAKPLLVTFNGWLLGVLFFDLLWDGLAVANPAYVEVSRNRYLHIQTLEATPLGGIAHGLLSAFFIILLLLSIYRAVTKFSFLKVIPVLCHGSNTAIIVTLLDPAKLAFRTTGSPQAAFDVFLYHSIMTVLCLIAFMSLWIKTSSKQSAKKNV